jgi:hypothetical protein
MIPALVCNKIATGRQKTKQIAVYKNNYLKSTGCLAFSVKQYGGQVHPKQRVANNV